MPAAPRPFPIYDPVRGVFLIHGGALGARPAAAHGVRAMLAGMRPAPPIALLGFRRPRLPLVSLRNLLPPAGWGVLIGVALFVILLGGFVDWAQS
jgi:hypothetical protein